MSKYLPITLSLEGKKVAVFGGGNVAERKIELLLDFGAEVTLISPEVTSDLKKLSEEGKITWVISDYEPGEVGKYFLVFAATDCNDTNHRISQEARVSRVLINVVDDPEYCDFILPSTLTRGPFMVSLSTSGISPALARREREKLEKDFGPEYQKTLKILKKLRERLLKDSSLDTKARGQRLLGFTSHDIPSLFKDGKEAEIDVLVQKLFGCSLKDLEGE